jgi:hypothetical protein
MKVKLVLNVTRILTVADEEAADTAVDTEVKKLEEAGWAVEIDSDDEVDDDGGDEESDESDGDDADEGDTSKG